MLPMLVSNHLLLLLVLTYLGLCFAWRAEVLGLKKLFLQASSLCMVELQLSPHRCGRGLQWALRKGLGWSSIEQCLLGIRETLCVCSLCHTRLPCSQCVSSGPAARGSRGHFKPIDLCEFYYSCLLPFWKGLALQSSRYPLAHYLYYPPEPLEK